ncbi:hypothetical protein DHD05_04880 [Arenibacter sp. N53]|uniref:hypothetical protein n=1 Tax=Arenibacter TaxID=178469 RepID=UPI000CD44D3A|nr:MULTISPECIES: hypothetical protein [Arenibacter]MCM4150920.1 hypothetical protein [Arenibacter sp. N53]
MENIRNFTFDKVRSGSASNTGDLFNELIKSQFDNVDTIKHIHKALINYMSIENPVFFLRLYGSYSKDNYDLLRRGFLTKYPNGINMSFCDNTFSLLFTGLKLANIAYSEFDLRNYLTQRQVVVGFGQTSNEKKRCYYSPKGALRAYLNTKGWYQAHIKPTGYGYEDLDLKKLFYNPPREEYHIERKIRYANQNLSNDQLKILKAHFLRLVHPFNSFLVPKRNHLEYNGTNIGEENELINYVRCYIKNTFPSEYNDFDKISMEYEIDRASTSISNIKWFDKPKNSKQTIPKMPLNEHTEKIIRNATKESGVSESTSDINLEKSLRAIGKEIFAVILFPELSKNIDVKYDEIAKKYQTYKSFTINSQRSRLSKAKSIFKAGEETEALLNVYDSNKIKTEVKSQIFKFINPNGH